MFIQVMKSDWKWRTIDLIGHVILALVLPGKWWFQFLPDILVPVLFIHGWITGRLLPKYNPLIVAHESFHTVVMPAAIIFGGFIGWKQTGIVTGLFMGCHWLGHIILDGFTHKLDWQKKALW